MRAVAAAASKDGSLIDSDAKLSAESLEKKCIGHMHTPWLNSDTAKASSVEGSGGNYKKYSQARLVYKSQGI